MCIIFTDIHPTCQWYCYHWGWIQKESYLLIYGMTLFMTSLLDYVIMKLCLKPLWQLVLLEWKSTSMFFYNMNNIHSQNIAVLSTFSLKLCQKKSIWNVYLKVWQWSTDWWWIWWQTNQTVLEVCPAFPRTNPSSVLFTKWFQYLFLCGSQKHHQWQQKSPMSNVNDTKYRKFCLTLIPKSSNIRKIILSWWGVLLSWHVMEGEGQSGITSSCWTNGSWWLVASWFLTEETPHFLDSVREVKMASPALAEEQEVGNWRNHDFLLRRPAFLTMSWKMESGLSIKLVGESNSTTCPLSSTRILKQAKGHGQCLDLVTCLNALLAWCML